MEEGDKESFLDEMHSQDAFLKEILLPHECVF